MTVINGRTAAHPLFAQQTSIGGTSVKVNQAPSYQNGYSASFEKYIDTLHIIDPTRILKAVPINPYTGSSW
jgi:hypothetical protein